MARRTGLVRSASGPAARTDDAKPILSRLACAPWLVVALACGAETPLDTPESSVVPPSRAESRPADFRFVDATLRAGLDFVHRNGMTGSLYLAEMTGGGGGFFDLEGDGDLDLYLVQGGSFEDGDTSGGDRLYCNQLVETGELRFQDVTDAHGLEARGYGMGVAAGDYDGDGDLDLYLTNLGPNQLWRNDGGRFVEVAALAGVEDSRWSTTAAWLDFDGDRDLDLFVGNYVDFSLATHKECHNAASEVDYCGPLAYRPIGDRLFRNRGDGTFDDLSVTAGVATASGGALGVVVADFDGNDRPDLYVANDGTPNHLWLNQGEGRFSNDATYAGCAVNREGRAEGSMGVDLADFDQDGDLDLFMTHIDEETNTLYVNDGGGLFLDRTAEAGLGAPSRGRTGFGTAWLDVDGDGRLDLVVANGAVRIIAEQARAGEPHPLKQRNQVLANIDGQRFQEVTDRAGPVFELEEVSRGLATGDVDNDGDTDLLLVNNHGPARLLLNESQRQGSWIGLRLVEGKPPRDAYGAVAVIHLDSGRSLLHTARAEGSYGVTRDPRILAGLGSGERVAGVEIRWPDGTLELFDALPQPEGRYLTLERGAAR